MKNGDEPHTADEGKEVIALTCQAKGCKNKAISPGILSVSRLGDDGVYRTIRLEKPLVLCNPCITNLCDELHHWEKREKDSRKRKKIANRAGNKLSSFLFLFRRFSRVSV